MYQLHLEDPLVGKQLRELVNGKIKSQTLGVDVRAGLPSHIEVVAWSEQHLRDGRTGAAVNRASDLSIVARDDH
jgi:hypothetical protein